MGTFHSLKITLGLLALAAGCWPVAAMEIGQQGPGQIQAAVADVLELHIEALSPGRRNSHFVLDSLPLPLPAHNLELFWLDEKQEDWIPLTGFVNNGEHLVCMNPSPDSRALDFLVVVQAKPWGLASWTLDPLEGTPSPEGPTAAEVEAALALGQELGTEALGQEPGTETLGQEPGTEALGQESREEEGAPEPPRAPGKIPRLGPTRGFPEAGAYLVRLAGEYGLSLWEIARASDEEPRGCGIYKITRGPGAAKPRALTYPKAAKYAEALNRINQQRGLRQAPFTADELFLGGRPLESLEGVDLFNFIVLKSRHLTPETVSTLPTRLDISADMLNRRLRGQTAITADFIDQLKSCLDLPALGLTEMDLDRLSTPSTCPYVDHPANVRARALQEKACQEIPGRRKTDVLDRMGLAQPRWTQIRKGTRKVGRVCAQRLSDFHNREFPDEPATTPEYFLGK